MKVFGRDIIKDFQRMHPNSKKSLEKFYEVAKAINPQNFADLKNMMSGVDLWKGRTIINVGGNKFRVIAIIRYERGQLTVVEIFTHKEYDLWNKKMRQR